jgi:hypothetical protein
VVAVGCRVVLQPHQPDDGAGAAVLALVLLLGLLVHSLRLSWGRWGPKLRTEVQGRECNSFRPLLFTNYKVGAIWLC